MLQSIYEKPRLVFGCGNPLFGDDGFGAEVIRLLETEFSLPEDVACLDAGTAVRDILFDILLSEDRPRQILIIDAMTLDHGAVGDIREIHLNQIQAAKIVDFSLHQFPTTNMLQEIDTHTDIDVRVLVVHPDHISRDIRPGLSDPVRRAVPEMCRMVMDLLCEDTAGSAVSEKGAVEIRVGALAERLGVHRNTVSNWIRGGKIRATPTIGKKYLIEKKELIRFCRASGVHDTILQELVGRDAGFQACGGSPGNQINK